MWQFRGQQGEGVRKLVLHKKHHAGVIYSITPPIKFIILLNENRKNSLLFILILKPARIHQII